MAQRMGQRSSLVAVLVVAAATGLAMSSYGRAASDKKEAAAKTKHQAKPTESHKPKPKSQAGAAKHPEKKDHKAKPEPKHKPKPKPAHKHKPKPSPKPSPPSNPSPPTNPQRPTNASFTIAGTVTGSVASLNNGVPTVAPGPVTGAQVTALAAGASYDADTDENGNFTITVSSASINPGSSVQVSCVLVTYETAELNVTAPASGATVSGVDFALSDDTALTTQRCSLFDGTGDGVKDNLGNEYHYLGRGEYYATFSGQLRIIVPTGNGIYSYQDTSDPAMSLGFRTSDLNGNYDQAGADWALVNADGALLLVFEPDGAGAFVDVASSGIYFKPLP
jgi:hypothetical protein